MSNWIQRNGSACLNSGSSYTSYTWTCHIYLGCLQLLILQWPQGFHTPPLLETMYPYQYREFKRNNISSNCFTNHALGPILGCSQLPAHNHKCFMLACSDNCTLVLYLELFLRSCPQQGSHFYAPEGTTSSCVPCSLDRALSIFPFLKHPPQMLTNFDFEDKSECLKKEQSIYACSND